MSEIPELSGRFSERDKPKVEKLKLRDVVLQFDERQDWYESALVNPKREDKVGPAFQVVDQLLERPGILKDRQEPLHIAHNAAEEIFYGCLAPYSYGWGI